MDNSETTVADRVARPRGPDVRRVARILAALFLVTVGIPCCLLVVDGLNDRLGRADVAVVLGNKIEPDGRPSARLAARLDRAIDVWSKGLCSFILVSGGVGIEGFDEAVAMKAYLVARGVPPGVVHVDSAGYDTYHTGRSTALFMKRRRLSTAMIVTQYFHISRTRLALRGFGVNCPFNACADYYEWRDLWQIPREAFGCWYYLLREYVV